jgi:beta-galactosidase
MYCFVLCYSLQLVDEAALRKVIHECTGTPLRPLPAIIERGNYGLVKLQKVASLFDILDKICDPLKAAVSEQPLSMEQSGQVATYPSICIFRVPFPLQ